MASSKNTRMLAQIELACVDGPTEEERTVAQAMRARHRRRIEREQ